MKPSALFFLFFGFSLGGVSRVLAANGSEGAAFLDIPVGAGPAALGSAYSALASDAYAPAWNPAGLGFLESNQLAAQHLSYLESIHYEYLGFVHPLQPGRSFGASVQYLGTGDLTGRDMNGNPTGDYSSHYASYNVAYGQAATEWLSLGVTGKVVQAAISDVSASAYAVDTGALLRVNEKLVLAGVATNVGTRLTFLRKGDSLPMAIKAGGSYRLRNDWLVSVEGVYRKGGVNSLHLGSEWRPLHSVAIRGGYKTDTTQELGPLAGVTAGIGVDVWGHELAYAWMPFGDLGSTHYFSLVLRFGEAERAKRNLIQYHTQKPIHRVFKETETDTPEHSDYQQLMQILVEGEARLAIRPESLKELQTLPEEDLR